MIARNLISDILIPLRTSDSGATALGLMDEYRVAHLPIVNDQDFLGMITDADIYSLNSFDDPVGNHPLSLSPAYVTEDQHIFDIIRAFAEEKLTLLAVLDKNRKYLGVITMANLVQHLSGMAALENPGGIIVLEVNDKDYSLAEISQIVESNDAKVLALYITSFPDSTKLEINLKLNRMDIGPVIQTFNRYDYIIKASYSDQDEYDDILRDRLDSLMKYLNI